MGVPERHRFSSLQGQSEVLLAQSCPTLCDPWTAARQAPMSLEFSGQEFWSGLPFSSPGDVPDAGIKPGLLLCQGTLYSLSLQTLYSQAHLTLEWPSGPAPRIGPVSGGHFQAPLRQTWTFCQILFCI